MNSHSRLALGWIIAGGLLLSGCQEWPSALAPQGPGAARIAQLWWTILVMGCVIYGGVMAVLLLALFRKGDARRQQRRGHRTGLALIVGGGVVLPAVVLLALFALTLRDMAAMAAPPRPPTLAIEVVGHQFWWEVIYPDHEVVTANEIHIPAGESIEMRFTSADVIHSFWAPELHGKMDLIPGDVTSIWLEASRPGVYRGVCAEYCGIQHAHMQLLVIAQPPNEFGAWLDHQRQPAAAPAGIIEARGQEVFLERACAACHTVRGTAAEGRAGPDLTHLASRRTIAARMLENNRDNLAAWIAEPQRIKRGNNMPNIHVEVDPDSFEALLAYLTSLE